MDLQVATDWHEAYRGTISDLPGVARSAPPTLCGLGACVDARVAMHDAAALFETDLPEAAALARLLEDRAERGIGGEVVVDWPGGPDWLAARLPVRRALGGTGPHAAWTLSAVGAPALLALEDRSAAMLELVPPDILLARDGRAVRAGAVRPEGRRRPEIFIFEYTAGRPVGAVVPTRSSRIIIRFHDLGLEHDDAFDHASRDLAATAGAALLSGFSAVEAADLGMETARVFALARSWRDAGLSTVHLELAGYATPALRETVLAGLRGAVTSVGMSQSEFLAIVGGTSPPGPAMARLADALGVQRLCVHADHWAASVTRSDPAHERRALLTGCLLAGARATAGHPVMPAALDRHVVFEPLPFEPFERLEAWSFVACASPYVRQPETTLGLGDTFTAGCLLILGRSRDG